MKIFQLRYIIIAKNRKFFAIYNHFNNFILKTVDFKIIYKIIQGIKIVLI